jgi:hypothetical protein
MLNTQGIYFIYINIGKNMEPNPINSANQNPNPTPIAPSTPVNPLMTTPPQQSVAAGGASLGKIMAIIAVLIVAGAGAAFYLSNSAPQASENNEEAFAANKESADLNCEGILPASEAIRITGVASLSSSGSDNDLTKGEGLGAQGLKEQGLDSGGYKEGSRQIICSYTAPGEIYGTGALNLIVSTSAGDQTEGYNSLYNAALGTTKESSIVVSGRTYKVPAQQVEAVAGVGAGAYAEGLNLQQEASINMLTTNRQYIVRIFGEAVTLTTGTELGKVIDVNLTR